MRDYVVKHLADHDAVLVINETGFLKHFKTSCGVDIQYMSSVGKLKNYHFDVFADYASRYGHDSIGRALYLLKSWTTEKDRLPKAHVPAETSFATKPRIAQAMVARAIAAGVPFRWVAADSVYGVGALKMALRRAGKG